MLHALPAGCWEPLLSLQDVAMEGVGAALSTLPANSFAGLTNLSSLTIKDVKGLTKLPPMTACSKLLEITLSVCSELKSLSGLGSSLEQLSLHRCSKLVSLTPAFCQQQSSLQQLSLQTCNKLERLPAQLWQLSGLGCLQISSCKLFKVLPSCISRLTGVNAASHSTG